MALEEQLRAIQWSTGIRVDDAEEVGDTLGDDGVVSIARYRSAMAAATPASPVNASGRASVPAAKQRR